MPRLTIVSHYPVAQTDQGSFTFNRVGEVANRLARVGWQTTVIARNQPRSRLARASFALDDEIPVIAVPDQGMRAMRALNRTDAALVFMPSLLSALAALILGRKAVMYAGASWKTHPDFGRARALLEGLAARRVSIVLTSGHAVADRFHGVARNVELCFPGVPAEVVSRLREHAAFPHPPEPPRALFVGAIARRKGVPELLDALRTLPDVECRFVGPADEPDLAQEARSLANVTVYSYAEWDELREHYAWANIFVLPSHTEGFPRVVFEASAYGLALVLTPVGGIPMRLEHGHDALFVPVGDITALQEAIRRLSSDVDERTRLATEARRTLVAALPASDAATQFDRVLRAAAV
jgi:glycosyltransferase involved in cell wall biosynthesis